MIILIVFMPFSHSFHIVNISICLVSQSIGLNVAFFGDDFFTKSLCSSLNPYILYWILILFTKSFYSLLLVNLALFNKSGSGSTYYKKDQWEICIVFDLLVFLFKSLYSSLHPIFLTNSSYPSLNPYNTY